MKFSCTFNIWIFYTFIIAISFHSELYAFLVSDSILLATKITPIYHIISNVDLNIKDSKYVNNITSIQAIYSCFKTNSTINEMCLIGI